MSYKIIPIPLKFGILKVNCYLIEIDDGFILIDTGLNKSRKKLENALLNAGCAPGDIQLLIITHGDFDHIGNCAYIRDKYCCQVVMHKDDEEMATEGNMFFNRKNPPLILRIIAKLLFRFKRNDRFSPDIYIKEGYDFTEYGFNAKVISIPGHSKGSIGILTDEGDLFCGDLLENIKSPSLAMIMDNKKEANESFEKLKKNNIKKIYPGHGNSFTFDEIDIKN